MPKRKNLDFSKLYGTFKIDELIKGGHGAYRYHCTVCGCKFIGSVTQMLEQAEKGCSQCKKSEKLRKALDFAETCVGKIYGRLEVLGVSRVMVYGEKKQNIIMMNCRCLNC